MRIRREEIMKELAKTYDPTAIEERTYDKWIDRKSVV